MIERNEKMITFRQYCQIQCDGCDIGFDDSKEEHLTVFNFRDIMKKCIEEGWYIGEHNKEFKIFCPKCRKILDLK